MSGVITRSQAHPALEAGRHLKPGELGIMLSHRRVHALHQYDSRMFAPRTLEEIIV